MENVVYFRWADALGKRLEQWNPIKVRWMPSERRIYRHCLKSGDVVVMNPVEVGDARD